MIEHHSLIVEAIFRGEGDIAEWSMIEHTPCCTELNSQQYPRSLPRIQRIRIHFPRVGDSFSDPKPLDDHPLFCIWRRYCHFRMPGVCSPANDLPHALKEQLLQVALLSAHPVPSASSEPDPNFHESARL
jgi:hypothetical protein